MSKLTITLSQFAHDLGAAQRITLEVSTVWHKQWRTSTPETRTALRDEFLTHFMRGMLACTVTEAVRVLTLTKGERNKAQQAAYMAASQKFKYHISRDGAKAKPVTVPSNQRIPTDLRAAAKAYLALFDNAHDAIKVLKAVA